MYGNYLSMKCKVNSPIFIDFEWLTKYFESKRIKLFLKWYQTKASWWPLNRPPTLRENCTKGPLDSEGPRAELTPYPSGRDKDGGG